MEAFNDFKIKIKMDVSWGDLDAMRHVNNSVFLKYFENSRIAYYDAIELGHFANKNELVGIVKSIRCDYLQPINFPDKLEIGTRVAEIIENGFIMEHYINSEKKGFCAYGETEVTIIDNKSSKIVQITQELKNAINNLENI